MSNTAKQEITVLLKSLKQGDKSTQDEIMKILYQELRGFAGRILSKENQTITFQATELVNEAYLKMFDSEKLDFSDRGHFLSTAIIVMRHFLVDHARKKNRHKRIPKDALDSLDEQIPVTAALELDLVALDEALTHLETLDPRQAKIVELRFFGGMSETEISKILNISRSTINREWMIAKMWLMRKIKA